MEEIGPLRSRYSPCRMPRVHVKEQLRTLPKLRPCAGPILHGVLQSRRAFSKYNRPQSCYEMKERPLLKVVVSIYLPGSSPSSKPLINCCCVFQDKIRRSDTLSWCELPIFVGRNGSQFGKKY